MSRAGQPAGKLIAMIRTMINDGPTRAQLRGMILVVLACALLVLLIVDLV